MRLDERIFMERLEEYSDKYYDIYVTRSAYDIKNYISGHPDRYRFIYCGSSGYYLIGSSYSYAHLDLAALAIDGGLSSDQNSQDAICYPSKADISSFNFTPGVFENTEEGKEQLVDLDCQLPYYYQYNIGAIGYRGHRGDKGLDEILYAFGQPKYIIDLSDRFYGGYDKQ